jgi:Reverse transcriptase (RNA-dependent DNA polymerase)
VQRLVRLGNSSRWKEVGNGVPQGSVLGLFLFLFVMDDINESVGNSWLKFADDTEVYSVVSDINDVNELQTDLKDPCDWSKDWLM